MAIKEIVLTYGVEDKDTENLREAIASNLRTETKKRLRDFTAEQMRRDQFLEILEENKNYRNNLAFLERENTKLVSAVWETDSEGNNQTILKKRIDDLTRENVKLKEQVYKLQIEEDGVNNVNIALETDNEILNRLNTKWCDKFDDLKKEGI